MLDRYQAGLRARASARGGAPPLPRGPWPVRSRDGTDTPSPARGRVCLILGRGAHGQRPGLMRRQEDRPRLLPDLMGDKKGDRGAAIGGSGVPVGAGRQGDGEVGRIYLALCGCF